MSKKVLIQVRLAATQKTYEFLVPVHLTVLRASGLIEEILAQREGPLFQKTGKSGLMYVEGENAGRMVDPNACFQDLLRGFLVVDGTLLALV